MLRKTFIRSGFGKGTTSVVPIKRLSVVIPSGLEARDESVFPTSFAASWTRDNQFLQIGAVEIAPFPILTEQSHSFFRCFWLVSDLSAASLATFTGDGGTVPV